MTAALFSSYFSSSLLSLPPVLSLQNPTPFSSPSYSLLKLSSRSPPSSNITSSRHSCASRRFYSPQGDRHPLPLPSLIGDPEAKGDAWDSSQHEALLKGGEQVVSLLQEMLKLLEDMEMDEASEPMAVEIVAQGVIGKRVDEMESGFMMALDYMIIIADKDHDEQNMESRPTIPDRKLLARLVLVREEARNMMGGGLLDERNDRGLSTLPEAEISYLVPLQAIFHLFLAMFSQL